MMRLFAQYVIGFGLSNINIALGEEKILGGEKRGVIKTQNVFSPPDDIGLGG